MGCRENWRRIELPKKGVVGSEKICNDASFRTIKTHSIVCIEPRSRRKKKWIKIAICLSFSLSFSRSSLTCPHCLKQSNTFDPFLCISLPIPLRQTRWGITHTQQVVELKVYCWKLHCLNYSHHSGESICYVHSSTLCFIHLLQASVHKENRLVKQKPLLAAGKSTLWMYEAVTWYQWYGYDRLIDLPPRISRTLIPAADGKSTPFEWTEGPRKHVWAHGRTNMLRTPIAVCHGHITVMNAGHQKSLSKHFLCCFHF